MNTMDKELRVYLEGMERRHTTDIASVKSDVGSLRADMVSVKSDGASLRSELVSMGVRLSTAVGHTREVLAQATKRGFDDTERELREMHAMLGATAEAVDADVPGWKEGSSEADLFNGHRKDLDGLAHRVKELEEELANRK